MLGLVGKGIEHSRSPAIHGALLKLAGLSGSYKLFDLPEEELSSFMRTMKDGRGPMGINVTIPHKIAVRSFVDEVDSRVEILGALNTVVYDNTSGILKGYNTDVYGFGAALAETEYGYPGASAIVYGYGGAARAVVTTLIEQGYRRIAIAGRDNDSVQDFLNGFCGIIGECHFEALDSASQKNEFDLLVNCAPFGQGGRGLPLEFSSLFSCLERKSLIFDLVYAPPGSSVSTLVVEEARSQGYRAIDGWGMLMHQALESFRIWTGVGIDKSALEAALAQK